MGSESNNKKVYITLLALFTIIMLFLTLFGDKGLWELKKLKNNNDGILENIEAVKEDNKRLSVEIERLKTDQRYIEEIARKEYGMVKDGEIIYLFQN